MLKRLNLKNHDWFLTLSVIALLLIGLVVIYSATFNATNEIEGAGTLNRQIVFVFLGLSIYLGFSFINPIYYRFRLVKILIFCITFFLLFFVLAFGDPVRNTNRWIEWGFIRIQPSEYSKIALIIITSSLFADAFTYRKNDETLHKWRSKPKKLKKALKINFSNIFKNNRDIFHYLLAFGIAFLFMFMIFKEPSLGTSLIVLLIVIILFLFSYPFPKKLAGSIFIFLIVLNFLSNTINFNSIYGKIGVSFMIKGFDLLLLFLSIIIILSIILATKLKTAVVVITITLALISVVSFKFIWNDYLEPYQKLRIETFLNPNEDPQGSGWQIRQSKIAIGSGRFFGKGFLQGSQSKLRFLPESYSDFIFAAYTEEFGFVGAIFLISIYLFLIIRILKTAFMTNNIFESLICIGIMTMITIHVFINIGMNMGIMPVTGIPLPLVSYGGSSIMVTMIGLGIVQSINMYRTNIDKNENLVITSEDLFLKGS